MLVSSSPKGAGACQNRLPKGRRLEFQSAVNAGSVTVKGHDPFGDDINIAARLQALSRPGGIYLSATAQEFVRKFCPSPSRTSDVRRQDHQ